MRVWCETLNFFCVVLILMRGAAISFSFRYRRLVNQSALFVNVDLGSSTSAVVESRDHNPLNVFLAGYSDAILRFVADMGEGHGVVCVETLKILTIVFPPLYNCLLPPPFPGGLCGPH